MDTEDAPITAESKLGAILARYPSVGPIIFQSGRAFVARPGDLYAQYPGLTVAEYARLNGLEVDGLTRRLQAEAEAAAVAHRAGRPADEEAASARRVSPLLGYTSAYRDREDSGGGARSVVSVQSAHGPE